MAGKGKSPQAPKLRGLNPVERMGSKFRAKQPRGASGMGQTGRVGRVGAVTPPVAKPSNDIAIPDEIKQRAAQLTAAAGETPSERVKKAWQTRKARGEK